jgi:putative transferase (TIGR04331 family)
MDVTKINIRATVLEEFWGDEYEDFRYLWEGALQNKSLSDIKLMKDKVCDNPFSNQKDIESGHLFCKDYYFRTLPVLAKTLNEIHDLDLDNKTWGIAFGYWLYRHISVIYDKFITLSKIDLENSSIKLLCESSYYVPENHSDYIFTFANDFGVQQLVSLYCRIFAKKKFKSLQKTHDIVRKNYLPSTIDSSIARCYRVAELARSDVEVVLLGTFFSEENNARLENLTNGRINTLTPPEVTLTKKVDWEIRKNIYKGESDCNFDIFFWESIKHCLPTVYLENFKALFYAYRTDIYKRDFNYIVSESWISDVWHSIYIASAKHHGKEFIAIEHAPGNVFNENGMHFIDLEFSDKFVSTGWSSNSQNVVSGGFMSRDIFIHRKKSFKVNILFVTFTRFVYWEEFNEENATNTFFFNRIERISKFACLLPKNLQKKLLVRPRSADGLWNVKNLLSLNERNINVDREDYSKSINSARLIVIDHMSTGLAEILQNRVPFILLYEINNIPLSSDVKLVFDQLLASKILHTTPESAVKHLVGCYPNIEDWWDSAQVQVSISQFTSFYLHPADRTISYLAGLLNKEHHDKPSFLRVTFIHLCNASGFCLRAFRKVHRLIRTRFRVLICA